jgi:SAM-dependent methyltransferase
MQHKLWNQKRAFRLLRCSVCGVIYTPDRPGTEAFSELYDHYYDRARFEIPSVVAASLDRLVVSMERYRLTGRWLDIGFGEGGLLSIARRHSWSCYGTEVSPAALEYGARQGWFVTSNPVVDPRFPAHGFDVISMVEILEHLPDPDGVMGIVSQLLRPGGMFYLTTPNAQSLNRLVLGAAWSIFSPPEHMVIWTSTGLCQALARHELTPQRIRTEGLNPNEIFKLLRPTDNGPTLSRNATGFRLNETFSRSPLRRKMKAGINHCLSMFHLGDSLKAWALRS